MTTLARRIASVPVRTSTETWEAVCDLLSPSGTPINEKLRAVTSVAGMLIAEEYSATDAIVATGSGPRVKVYTVHGDDAIDALAEETPLSASPCAEAGWEVSFPCSSVDLDEIKLALKALPNFTVHLSDSDTMAEPIDRRSDGAKPIIDLSQLESS